jgi:hypothetical protein
LKAAPVRCQLQYINELVCLASTAKLPSLFLRVQMYDLFPFPQHFPEKNPKKNSRPPKTGAKQGKGNSQRSTPGETQPGVQPQSGCKCTTTSLNPPNIIATFFKVFLMNNSK